MRITAERLAQIHAGYILVADVLESDAPELYVSGTRVGYAGLLAELTSQPNVLQVHSYRLAPASEYGKSDPTPIRAEDFGTMAGALWSGDEFALDGLGDEDV